MSAEIIINDYTVIRLTKNDGTKGFYNSSISGKFVDNIYAATKWRVDAEEADIFNVYKQFMLEYKGSFRDISIVRLYSKSELSPIQSDFYEKKMTNLALSKLTVKEIELLGASHLLAQSIIES